MLLWASLLTPLLLHGQAKPKAVLENQRELFRSQPGPWPGPLTSEYLINERVE